MAKSDFSGFDPSLFQFLEQLKRNNKTEWFQKNKKRYEAEVLEPALAFLATLGPHVKKISPSYPVEAKKSGGALMRLNRDTRFSKDKTPYKTNIGMFIKHQMHNKVNLHAPSFYVHLAPDECFVGVGVWHPEPNTLGKIRGAIDTESTKWKRARDNKRFRADFELVGESLKTPPRGFAKDHPMAEDLRRKDFIGMCRFDRKDVFKPGFPKFVAEKFKVGAPYMSFICDALGIPF